MHIYLKQFIQYKKLSLLGVVILTLTCIFSLLFNALFLLQLANSGLEQLLLLKCYSFRNERQCDPHKSLLSKQIIHKLIQVDNGKFANHTSYPQFTIIVVEGLQFFICFSTPENQPEIKQCNCIEIFVVSCLQVLYRYLLGQVHLQQLEDQTQEFSWFFCSTVQTSDVIDLDGFIKEGLSVEGEALLFPVPAVKYVMPSQLIDKLHILVICHSKSKSKQYKNIYIIEFNKLSIKLQIQIIKNEGINSTKIIKAVYKKQVEWNINKQNIQLKKYILNPIIQIQTNKNQSRNQQKYSYLNFKFQILNSKFQINIIFLVCLPIYFSLCFLYFLFFSHFFKLSHNAWKMITLIGFCYYFLLSLQYKTYLSFCLLLLFTVFLQTMFRLLLFLTYFQLMIRSRHDYILASISNFHSIFIFYPLNIQNAFLLFKVKTCVQTELIYFIYNTINNMMDKKILIAGGDGFIGWPLSLRMSKLGWDVCIVDNLARRKVDAQNGYSSITPIKSIQERIDRWKQLTGKQIRFENIDIAAEKQKFFKLFEEYNPSVIVHLAEQKSAPYSMKSIQTIDYTYENNCLATKNVLIAVMKYNNNCHIIHIGTMGVYGYGAVEGLEIPEGFCMAKLNCLHKEKCQCQPVEILHPYYPGSVYHMTKCLDNVTLVNFQKYFNLKITELHQGIVWGVSTPETQMHPDLINRIDIDSDYGTVFNRFCSQVAYGFPITLYGTGKQTRAFININDSIQCLLLAIEYGRNNELARVNILNQMTATHELNELKDLLVKLYPDATYEYIENPRQQKIQNVLKVKNEKFKNLGYVGIPINEDSVRKLVETCRQYKHKFEQNLKYVKPISFWKTCKKQ